MYLLLLAYVDLLYVVLLFALYQMIQKAEMFLRTREMSSLSGPFVIQRGTNGS